MKSLAAIALATLALSLPATSPAAAPDAAPGGALPSPALRFQQLTGLDDPSWKLTEESPTQRTFRSANHVLVTFLVLPRRTGTNALPTEQVAAQDSFREQAGRLHASLVEVQVRPLAHDFYDLVTMKFRVGDMAAELEGSLARYYQMNAIVNVDDTAEGILQVASWEDPPLDLRESTVSLIQAHRINHDQFYVLQRRDPYDARYDATAQYTESDAREWDPASPTGPLTRIRVVMEALLARSPLYGGTVGPPDVTGSPASGVVAAPVARAR